MGSGKLAARYQWPDLYLANSPTDCKRTCTKLGRDTVCTGINYMAANKSCEVIYFEDELLVNPDSSLATEWVYYRRPLCEGA